MGVLTIDEKLRFCGNVVDAIQDVGGWVVWSTVGGWVGGWVGWVEEKKAGSRGGREVGGWVGRGEGGGWNALP